MRLSIWQANTLAVITWSGEMSYMKQMLPEVDEGNQANEEMYERTHEILAYLVDILPPEDFCLMCFHTGFSVYDFKQMEQDK